MEDPGNLKNSAQNGLQQNYNDNASRDSVDYKQVRWNMITKQQNRKQQNRRIINYLCIFNRSSVLLETTENLKWTHNKHENAISSCNTWVKDCLSLHAVTDR